MRNTTTVLPSSEDSVLMLVYVSGCHRWWDRYFTEIINKSHYRLICHRNICITRLCLLLVILSSIQALVPPNIRSLIVWLNLSVCPRNIEFLSQSLVPVSSNVLDPDSSGIFNSTAMDLNYTCANWDTKELWAARVKFSVTWSYGSR